MSFFSGNTFSGGGYSCARHDTALVRGIEVPADQTALAIFYAALFVVGTVLSRCWFSKHQVA